MLAELWTAAGKPLEADRLKVYRQSLGEVPLGLLERAVRRVIRENVYHVGPLTGAVWAAMRRTLRVCFARSWGIRGISGWRWRIGSRAGRGENEGAGAANGLR